MGHIAIIIDSFRKKLDRLQTQAVTLRTELDLEKKILCEVQEQFKLLKQNFASVTVTPLTIDLPNHLRTTYQYLTDLGKATAQQIAEYSKRARAVESGYLNQLCMMQIAEKHHIGR